VLRPDRIDVWRIAGCDRANDGEAALAFLSDEELIRAGRFVSDSARRTFTAVRVALRCILADYVGRTPGSLRFEYGAFGKPSLSGDATLQFSVSHSGDVGVVAVSSRRVGIDVEQVRYVTDDVLADSLTPGEQARVGASSDPLASFFAHWTLKEAYLKARGVGLNVPLRSVQVIPGESNQIDLFHLSSFHLSDGCVAAVAVELEPGTSPPGVNVRDWDRRTLRFRRGVVMLELDRAESSPNA
jgi:4'-phosphopantetheinyl transferase